MRFEQPTVELLLEAAHMSTVAGVGMRPAEIETEIASGRLQPKWSQVAIDEDESLVGRALWWGRDAQVPLALDVWDARRDHPDTEKILIELLDMVMPRWDPTA